MFSDKNFLFCFSGFDYIQGLRESEAGISLGNHYVSIPCVCELSVSASCHRLTGKRIKCKLFMFQDSGIFLLIQWSSCVAFSLGQIWVLDFWDFNTFMSYFSFSDSKFFSLIFCHFLHIILMADLW